MLPNLRRFFFSHFLAKQTTATTSSSTVTRRRSTPPTTALTTTHLSTSQQSHCFLGFTSKRKVSPGRVRGLAESSWNVEAFSIRRCFGTSVEETVHSAGGHVRSEEFVIGDLTPESYHRLSDATMERLLEYFENLGDELEELQGYDIEYLVSQCKMSGVLTLKCGSTGTYVLNKQPPNKQIWLSSPISGPKRYDYDHARGKWFYHRDQSTLDELLNRELSTVFQRKVDVFGETRK